jgi:hypothetical protein
MAMASRFPSPLARAVAAALGLGLLAGEASLADEKRWFENSDKVFIRQRDQFERIQEPDVHLDRARRGFAKENRAYAADELEKAAAGFAYFADRAAGSERKELEIASHALNRLADQVRRDEVDEITTLDRAIADAKRVLAGEPAPAGWQPPPKPAPPPPAS